MPLVTSLLTAIVRADGDALVLHAGECPYVVAPSGQSGLASRVLTFEAMTGLLGELLPEEARQTLDELGAVQHVLPSQPFAAGETFTVVAARGGDDIWIEIRRRRAAAAELHVARAPPEVKPAADVPRTLEGQMCCPFREVRSARNIRHDLCSLRTQPASSACCASPRPAARRRCT